MNTQRLFCFFQRPHRSSCCLSHRRLAIFLSCFAASAIYLVLDQKHLIQDGAKTGRSWVDSLFLSYINNPGSENSKTQGISAPIGLHLSQETYDQGNRSTGHLHKQQLSAAKILIIVAYMRTGSTLTGKLFEQYPGSLFGFEPLRAIDYIFNTGQSEDVLINYPDSLQRLYKRSEKRAVLIAEMINWLTCNLRSLSIPTLTDEFLNIFSIRLKPFYLCMFRYGPRKRRKFYNMPISNTTLNRCLPLAIGVCQKSSVLILKYIRLRMDILKQLMPFFPGLKVIHLNRDPRGMFNSRIKLQFVTRSNILPAVNDQCKNISEDLKVSHEISVKFPGRIKTVKYEDITEHPLEMSKDLLHFLGLQFTPGIESFVQSMTSSTRDGCSYCIARKNSTLTANKWRKQMPLGMSREIFNICKETNAKLGYLPYNSVQELHDMNVPSSTHQT